MNASIGFAMACFVLGISGRVGAVNAQCDDHVPPSSIHAFSVAICAAVSFLPLFGGGIISSASFEVTRPSSSFLA